MNTMHTETNTDRVILILPASIAGVARAVEPRTLLLEYLRLVKSQAFSLPIQVPAQSVLGQEFQKVESPPA